MVDINSIFSSIFSVIGQITGMIRNFVVSFLPNYSDLVLLGLALGGGYYITRKYSNIPKQFTIVVYAVIIYLLLRFV